LEAHHHAKLESNRHFDGRIRALRGLKHKQPPTSGLASAQKSRRTDRAPLSLTPENTGKTTGQQDSGMRQSRSPFLHNAQNAANPDAQKSGPK
jgi:hypothetical protein